MASESFELSASNLDNIARSAKNATDKVKDFERAAKSLGFGNATQMFRQQPRLAASIARGMGFTTPPSAPGGASGGEGSAGPSAGPNWARALVGAAISPISPYFGGRTIAGSGVLGGGAGAMVPIVGGVIASLYLFKHALAMATEAVHRGSQLYQQAAMTARRPGQLAQAQLALAGIGIDPATTNRLLLQAQFSRGRGASGSFSGMLLRSGAGAGDVGTMQQIRNMSKELDYMADRSSWAAKAMGESAGAMNRIGMEAQIFSNNLSGAMMRVLSESEPLIISFLKLAQGMAKLEGIAVRIALGLVSGGGSELVRALRNKDSPGDQKIAGGSMQPLVSSHWQRIGFSFGNFPGLDYAKETAKNTKAIAQAVTKRGGDWLTPFITGATASGFHMP